VLWIFAKTYSHTATLQRRRRPPLTALTSHISTGMEEDGQLTNTIRRVSTATAEAIKVSQEQLVNCSIDYRYGNKSTAIYFKLI